MRFQRLRHELIPVVVEGQEVAKVEGGPARFEDVEPHALLGKILTIIGRVGTSLASDQAVAEILLETARWRVTPEGGDKSPLL